ncbi:phage portal protein [Laceyella putida]|uniref:Phage portal protein n=1 Tax=Laceyella putida TaxID=110101 RepID=A0ABW2RR35_9BACL
MFNLSERIKQFEKKAAPTFLTTWTHVRTDPEIDLYALTEEGYRKNSIASACISMIATSAPEAPLKVYRPTPEGLEELPDHWLSRLLTRPNPFLSSYELWEWVHTFLNTAGNAYLLLRRNHIDAPIVEMEVLRSDCMIPVVNDAGNIVAYHYQVSGQPIRFEPWQILHLKFPDPLNPSMGLSPLARVMREVGIDNEATDFTRAFFKNAAVPYGILSSDQRLREEEVERTREKWFQWFKGFKGRNRFKPAVLGQGLDYKQIGLSFSDMEFETVRALTETRICGAFGVDPVLIPSYTGIKYGGKYSNYSEARKHLWEETIVPALKRIESKITAQLLASEGLVAQFDLSQVKALQENEERKFARVSQAFQAGITTLNEARMELGMKPDDTLGDRYAFQLQGQGQPGLKSMRPPLQVIPSDEFIPERKRKPS